MGVGGADSLVDLAAVERAAAPLLATRSCSVLAEVQLASVLLAVLWLLLLDRRAFAQLFVPAFDVQVVLLLDCAFLLARDSARHEADRDARARSAGAPTESRRCMLGEPKLISAELDGVAASTSIVTISSRGNSTSLEALAAPAGRRSSADDEQWCTGAATARQARHGKAYRLRLHAVVKGAGRVQAALGPVQRR